MERIEGESPTDDIPSRESGLTSLVVFPHERTLANRPQGSDADMSAGGNACWCGS